MRKSLVTSMIMITILILYPISSYSEEKQFVTTDVGTYDVSLKTSPEMPQPGEKTRMFLEVLTNPARNAQLHVDYEVIILSGSEQIFTSGLDHTDTGTTSISYNFDSSGNYFVIMYIDGIIFKPIPTEIAGFQITVGGAEETPVVEETEKEEMKESKTVIPQWIKQVAEFWVADEIDNAAFVQVIEYLVKEGLITIPYAEVTEEKSNVEIPVWIKNNAEFWINGDISDEEFAIGLEWLVNNGIIQV